MKRKSISHIFFIVIFIFFLIFFLFVDFNHIKYSIVNFNFYIISLIFFIIYFIIDSLSWKLLIDSNKIKFLNLFAITIIGWFTSQVAKFSYFVSEPYKAFLASEKINSTNAISSLFLYNFSKMIAKLLIIIIILFFYPFLFAYPLLKPMLISTVILTVIIILLFIFQIQKKGLFSYLNILFKKLSLIKEENKILALSEQKIRQVLKHKKRKILLTSFLLFTADIFKFIGICLIINNLLSIKINYIDMVFIFLIYSSLKIFFSDQTSIFLLFTLFSSFIPNSLIIHVNSIIISQLLFWQFLGFIFFLINYFSNIKLFKKNRVISN